MSLFGKILAVLNVLAAIGFVYLATQVRGLRHGWAYAAMRHEIILNGLPVDEDEKRPDGEKIVADLNASTLQQLFQPVGGNSVKTQEEEVQRRKNELRAEVNEAPDEAGKRRKLESILLPLARTGAERDALRQEIRTAPVDKLLEGLFEQAFETARERTRQGKDREPDERRMAIAYLLFGVSEDPADREKTERNQRRVLVVVGLPNYIRAVDDHALVLDAMGQRMRKGIEDDRSAFVLQHEAKVTNLLDIANHIDHLKALNQNYVEQKERNHQPLVENRKKALGDLQTELAQARKVMAAALARQTKLEAELFATQRVLGTAAEKNLELERKIRTEELGR